MTTALIITACVLLIAVIFLSVKIIILKSGIRSINLLLPEIIQGGTNRLLPVGGGDGSIKELVTQLNRSLAELREKELKYKNGDREVKSALTNAAHDVRTPLTAIRGYLDLLENESDPAKAENYLNIIRERADALAKLSEELFIYSVTADGSENVKREPIDAGNILKECLTDYYEMFCAKQIIPDIDIPTPSFTLAADKLNITRMFSNIISNALKYAEGDFKVTLKGKVITFGNTADSVDAIDINRLFDRFYTVKSGKNSTGLGLSIAKTICERYGGQISASLDGNFIEIRLSFN